MATSPVGFTAQSFVSLSLDPPLVAVCPALSSTSWPRIAAADGLCINILGDDQEALCRGFATPSEDKFAGIGWRGAPDDRRADHRRVAGVDRRSHRSDVSRGRSRDRGDQRARPWRRVDARATTTDGPLLFYRAGFGSFSV